MKIKENLKNFFKPDWKKIFLLFVLEFLISFTLLFIGDRLPSWQIYLMSPNILYLESTINPMFVTPEKISLHGAVANLIALIYFYFLSCLIIGIRGKLNNFLSNLITKKYRK